MFNGPFINRRKGLIKPPGRVSVNTRNPLAHGLSLLYAFEGLSGPLLCTRGVSSKALNGGADIKPGRGGVGLVSTAGGAFLGVAGAGNTYTLPAVGTMLFLVGASFAANDGAKHYLFSASGASGSPTGSFEFLKFSDNNFYFGWDSGGEQRAVVAATGLFNAGDIFVVGGPWNVATGTKLYVKGKFAGSTATLPVIGTNINGGNFIIGSDSLSFANPWNKAVGDGIYMLAVWDRELSAAEIMDVSIDPYSILHFPEDEMLAMINGRAILVSSGVQPNICVMT